MNDATRTELQAALGADWRVVGGTPPPKPPPGRGSPPAGCSGMAGGRGSAAVTTPSTCRRWLRSCGPLWGHADEAA
jgi:hypothetical protein